MLKLPVHRKRSLMILIINENDEVVARGRRAGTGGGPAGRPPAGGVRIRDRRGIVTFHYQTFRLGGHCDTVP